MHDKKRRIVRFGLSLATEPFSSQEHRAHLVAGERGKPPYEPISNGPLTWQALLRICATYRLKAGVIVIFCTAWGPPQ